MTIEDNDDRRSLIRTVTLCLCTLFSVVALCLAVFFKTYADPTILTALIATTGTLVGALAMSKPQQPSTTTTNTTTNNP